MVLVEVDGVLAYFQAVVVPAEVKGVRVAVGEVEADAGVP